MVEFPNYGTMVWKSCGGVRNLVDIAQKLTSRAFPLGKFAKRDGLIYASGLFREDFTSTSFMNQFVLVDNLFLLHCSSIIEPGSTRKLQTFYNGLQQKSHTAGRFVSLSSIARQFRFSSRL